MQVSFRHGIIQTPQNFLTHTNNNISITLQQHQSIQFTIADGHSNYLFLEPITVSDAWVGPFTPTVSYWLYWDINTLTGVKSYGYTVYEPIESAAAPANPVTNQHWFDTIHTTMFVFNGSTWIRKIRLFAAKVTGNGEFVSESINSPLFTGTQVGNLNTVKVGYLVYDSTNNTPFKKSDNTFFTTEDVSFTGITSSAQVKFNGILIEATANSNIPAYSIVRYSDFGIIDIANNYLIDNGTYGIIETSVTTGENVNVTMEGLITSFDWDWTSVGINTPLYVNGTGTLTATVPPTPIIVATVVDVHTILLRPSTLFLNTFDDPASDTNVGSVMLSVPPVQIDLPIAVGVNDDNYLAIVSHLADDTSHINAAEHTVLIDIVNHTADLSVVSVLSNNSQHPDITLVDSSGMVNWDLNDSTFATLTLTNDTIITPTNLKTGTIIILTIIQDNVGLHNLVFNPVFKWVGGSAPDFSTIVADNRYIFTFISDGVSLFEVSRSLII